jgi:hypothetical protein
MGMVRAFGLSRERPRKQTPREWTDHARGKVLTHRGYTMPELNPLDAVLQQTVAAQEAARQEAAPDEDEGQEDEGQEEKQEAQDDKQLNILLRKCENAFTKGNKGLLLSRVECGKWSHAVYEFRASLGLKDRSHSSTLIFNRLAVHADSPRECNATELAKMYQVVNTLCTPERWKAMSKLPKHPLTIGKLTDMLPLVTGPGDLVKAGTYAGKEVYTIFNPERTEEAKALFVWACGDGLSAPSREDIHNRVMELTDPKKYAEKLEKDKKAAEEKDASKDAEKDAEEEDEPEAPDNLISTEVQSRPMPNWKDIGENMASLADEARKQEPDRFGEVRDGFAEKIGKLTPNDAAAWMGAFFHHGAKRNVGKAHEIVMEFAKQFVWTSAMVKGLLEGIAHSKDAEAADKAMQTIVDTIADEYGVYPSQEVEEKEAA